jgi:hypothetical protein
MTEIPKVEMDAAQHASWRRDTGVLAMAQKRAKRFAMISLRDGSIVMRRHSAALGARYRLDAIVKEGEDVWKFVEVVSW